MPDANLDGNLTAALRRLLDTQAEASAGYDRAEIDATSPIFILCCARSGSTLLRVLLNNHGDIACPPETHLPSVANALIQMWASTEGGNGWAGLSDEARGAICETVSRPLQEFASKRGKKVWCDKSASNIPGAELLLELFPAARFICLYRHPMDVIASGLSASRWGFAAYGFEPYVRMSTDNLVRALAVFWYDQIAAVRRFERKHAGRCTRVYYETLVSAPEITGRVLCDGLGISWDPAILTPDFGSVADFGAGDFKLPYTHGIEASRMGRGLTVPAAMIPPELLLVINTLLAELEYPQIGADWNVMPHPFVAEPEGSAADQDAIDEVIGVLGSGMAALAANGDGQAPLIRLNLSGSPDPFLMDGAAGRIRDGKPADEADVVISATAHALLAVAAGGNLGAAMREGDVRLVGQDTLMTAREEYLIAKWLMNVLIAGKQPAIRQV